MAINEYQLILNPHEELRTRVLQLRAAFSEGYQAPTLAGKPHVTLVRFTQLVLMEERILQRLRTIAMGFCPFKVELKDFGSLPTHSIFINVISKLPIRGLVTEIRDVQRLMKLDKENKPHFLDEPNLLIARKLLPGSMRRAGWNIPIRASRASSSRTTCCCSNDAWVTGTGRSPSGSPFKICRFSTKQGEPFRLKPATQTRREWNKKKKAHNPYPIKRTRRPIQSKESFSEE